MMIMKMMMIIMAVVINYERSCL